MESSTAPKNVVCVPSHLIFIFIFIPSSPVSTLITCLNVNLRGADSNAQVIADIAFGPSFNVAWLVILNLKVCKNFCFVQCYTHRFMCIINMGDLVTFFFFFGSNFAYTLAHLLWSFLILTPYIHGTSTCTAAIQLMSPDLETQREWYPSSCLS